MALGQQDSSFELAFVPYGNADGGAPRADALGSPRDLPLLDLNSTDPLPNDLPDTPLPTFFPSAPQGESFAALSLGLTHNGPRAPGSLWLQGDVLMCACPECAAPMSVRVWLMIADCWKCNTSIELSEEQEREARRLLRESENARQSAANPARQRASERAPAAPLAADANGSDAAANGAQVKATPREAHPQTERASPKRDGASVDRRQSPSPAEREARQNRVRRGPRRVPAAQRMTGVRAQIRKMAVGGAVQVWVHDFFRNMPAWVISLVIHLVLLTLMALFLLDDGGEEPEFLLTTEISPTVREGGDPEAQLAKDEAKFDLPVPSQDLLKDPARREAIVRADQEARELRLDPNDPTPDLPPLESVQEALRSGDTVRRSFAARDPRMRVEMVKSEGGTTLTEAAVARALRWIAGQQRPDGGWSLPGRGAGDCGGTSLALLPFLGAGQTHQTGIYRDHVSLGLRWLIEHQAKDGDLRHNLKGDNAGMYAHGQGAIVLCEAYALTGDNMLKEPAQKAIDFIVAAQHPGGGWRYQPGEAGDTSVVGWQLMALHSAKVSGLNVPPTTVELAGNYLDSVQSDGGSKYCYRRGTAPNDAITAEGLLCRMYTGWTKQNVALENGLRFLMKDHMPRRDAPNIYYWYYGTQVAHHMGGREWERWNLNMRDILVDTQIREGPNAGAWEPQGPHAGAGGHIYMTSLATCSLEVYYRHAPIFRQLELDPAAEAAVVAP
jgi:hypothetical protein